MITDDRARALAFAILAHLTSSGPRPALDALDFFEAKLVAAKMCDLSGRSVALVVDEVSGRAGFVFLDEVLPKIQDADLDAHPDPRSLIERIEDEAHRAYLLGKYAKLLRHEGQLKLPLDP